MEKNREALKKPLWLRKKVEYSEKRHSVKNILHDLDLNTVCSHARCPNLSECYSSKRATFMILGNKCTRNCTFCAVECLKPGQNLSLDEDEPERICKAVKLLGLRYVVITSVTRDDIPDGGAMQFARTVLAIKKYDDTIKIEVLTPDFLGRRRSIDTVANCVPDVYNHNIETVPRLYKQVRPQADYQRSIQLLKYLKANYPALMLKSGFMVGLGESKQEVIKLLHELKTAGCDAVTIGQYLRPSRANFPVQEYVHPDIFRYYENEAKRIGFLYVASGPYVRSSYMAHEGYERLKDWVDRVS
ncbi:MAG: lipoyl synthase [Spirochaetota bacterium]|nr:MAG: lipoyl synthase [Spirochaetota bacterium]